MEKKVVRNIRFMTNEYTDSQEILEKARRTINKNELNFKVVDDDSADIVVPIGGDGAFLKAFRKTNFNSDLVYVGINTGTIGFLQSADENMLEKTLEVISKGLEKYRLLPLLDITFKFEDHCEVHKAINEIEVGGCYGKVFDFSQLVNGCYLHEARASGIIISSSTGSTAVNKSYGGPILMADGFVVSTIRGIANSPTKKPYVAQPIVAKSTKIVFPDINKEREKNPSFNRFRNPVYFAIDGLVLDNIDQNNLLSIEVSVSNEKLRTVNFSGLSRIEVLRDKLL